MKEDYRVVFEPSSEEVDIKSTRYGDNEFFNSFYGRIDRTISLFKGITTEKISNKEVITEDVCSNEADNVFPFYDLPEPLLVIIFSKLDVASMCQLSRVCKRWYNCLNDSLIWRKKLDKDSLRWSMIDHLSHPTLHQLTNPDFSSKEIYIKCCPEYRKFYNKDIMSFRSRIPNFRYYFGFSTPRVVIFGSGLDSSGFIRGLFWNKTSPFEVKGMFPGQFDGIGSGVTLQYSGGMLNMITLYSLCKAERSNQAVENDRKSNLLSQQTETNEIVLSQRVRELLSTVDALIYIVNSSSEERVTFGKEEFHAMTDSRWIPIKIPILVLCTLNSSDQNSVPPLHVADHLSMLHLNRPWQVQQCFLDSLQGLLPSIKWLHRHILNC